MKSSLAFLLFVTVFVIQTQDAECGVKNTPFYFIRQVGKFLADLPLIGPLLILPLMPVLMPVINLVIMLLYPLVYPLLPDVNPVSAIGSETGLDEIPGVGDALGSVSGVVPDLPLPDLPVPGVSDLLG